MLSLLEEASRKEWEWSAHQIDFTPYISKNMLQKLVLLSILIKINNFYLLDLYRPFYLIRRRILIYMNRLKMSHSARVTLSQHAVMSH